MFEFIFLQDFLKSLHKCPLSDQALVKDKLKKLATFENPLLVSKKLKGYKNIYRFRLGNYRVIFQLNRRQIILLSIDHRKDVYKNF